MCQDLSREQFGHATALAESTAFLASAVSGERLLEECCSKSIDGEDLVIERLSFPL